MANTSWFVLRNTATGTEATFRSLADAVDAVESSIPDGDHWVLFMFGANKVGLFADIIITHGCGREISTRVKSARQLVAAQQL